MGKVGKQLLLIKSNKFLKEKLRLVFGSLDVGNRLRHACVLSVINQLELKGKRLLDAGCGRGAFTLRVAYKHPENRIVGIDSGLKEIEESEAVRRVLGIKNLSFRNADLTHSLDENEYDLIYCVDALEHIRDDEAVLGNFFNALKPDCNLLLHVPLLNQRRYFSCFDNWQQLDHVRDGYDERSLVNMLKRSGFAVTDKKYNFGWAGSLAWEMDEICRRYFGKIAKLVIFPVLSLLITLDLKLKNRNGNTILISAMRESYRAN
jgi:ubiquinone/menaquinone biosynthesis C-methylase UbiE